MAVNKNYIFRSTRLGFRNWIESDIETMSEINSDHEVMEFFPSTKSKLETQEFIERMKKSYAEKGFCYFAVDKIDGNEFIGFIGIAEQTFEADFTPCVDIGWRLKRTSWNQGFATEGAKRCLEYAFDELSLRRIVAMAPIINKKSEQVMNKIGMNKVKNFKHPLLEGNERLEECGLYEILKNK